MGFEEPRPTSDGYPTEMNPEVVKLWGKEGGLYSLFTRCVRLNC